ncbi:MAG: HlyD family type I secretion periplasmic adaptor subunit [Pseudomonadota bacterium]
MSIRHRVAAYKALFDHYAKVFQHFWKQRKATDGDMFNVHEAEFMPAALSLQEKPVSSAAKWTARTLMLMLATVLAWSILGHMDIVVNAPGKIIPSTRTKTIASVDIASVRRLHVVEGQQVKAGDRLVELDTSTTDAERDKAIGDQGEGVLQAARAKALIAAIDRGQLPALQTLAQQHLTDQSGNTLTIPAEKWEAEQLHVEGIYRDYLAKLRRIEGDIARYSQALPLATQRANDYASLLKDRDVAHHAWLEKEQSRVDLAGQLADARNQRAVLIAETRRLAFDQLTEGSRIAAAASQDAFRSNARSKLMTLTAPVNGTVQQLMVHTIGGVVPAAQPLMQIVPDESSVEVEAVIENRDVGFVENGQPAAVKIDAFDFGKYGTVPATVTHVSRDAIEDEKKGLIYAIKVRLAKSAIAVQGKVMPLSAGMSVNVEIKTGERRIIEYVLSPLKKHQREAMNER